MSSKKQRIRCELRAARKIALGALRTNALNVIEKKYHLSSGAGPYTTRALAMFTPGCNFWVA